MDEILRLAFYYLLVGFVVDFFISLWRYWGEDLKLVVLTATYKTFVRSVTISGFVIWLILADHLTNPPIP